MPEVLVLPIPVAPYLQQQSQAPDTKTKGSDVDDPSDSRPLSSEELKAAEMLQMLRNEAASRITKINALLETGAPILNALMEAMESDSAPDKMAVLASLQLSYENASPELKAFIQQLADNDSQVPQGPMTEDSTEPHPSLKNPTLNPPSDVLDVGNKFANMFASGPAVSEMFRDQQSLEALIYYVLKTGAEVRRAGILDQITAQKINTANINNMRMTMVVLNGLIANAQDKDVVDIDFSVITPDPDSPLGKAAGRLRELMLNDPYIKDQLERFGWDVEDIVIRDVEGKGITFYNSKEGFGGVHIIPTPGWLSQAGVKEVLDIVRLIGGIDGGIRATGQVSLRAALAYYGVEVKDGKITAGDLKVMVESLKTKSDNLSSIAQMDAVKLQQMNAALSELITLLSNLSTKLNDVINQLIQAMSR